MDVTSPNTKQTNGYLASGDVTKDSQRRQYLYDAEGRICAVGTTSSGMWGYLYDASGNRVAKGKISSLNCNTASNGFTLTNSYVLTQGGQQLTELTWSGGTAAWANTIVRAGGQLIATYRADPDPSQGVAGILEFQFGDWLGTRRLVTDYTGNPEESCDSLPYGDGETCIPTANGNGYFFTQHQRDAETGNDYFGARYYGSSMGRFLSPDPLPWIAWQNGSRTQQQAFEAHLANPQDLNMYSYVLNNPLNKTDPTGMNACGTNNDTSCHVTVTLKDRSKDANGHYNDQFTGVKNQGNYNATATVSVNGKVVGTFLAKTTPSDSSKFGTIANGTYAGTLTIHDHQYAIRLQPSNDLPTAVPNPAHGGAMYAQGILVHQSGLGNYTGTFIKNGAEHGVSEGCQLVCRSEYGGFLGATGISPADGSARQQHFTVVIDTQENSPQ